jgi:sec-independent protein translocase protein TatA
MFSGISIWQLLIVLAIVLAIFGTKRFRNIGSDLGSAIKGFRSAMGDGDNDAQTKNLPEGEDADFEENKTKEGSGAGKA